jgi:hypothetical protein
MAGPSRDRLQIEISGRSFRISSMKDVPIMEDPSPMATAGKFFNAASGASTSVYGLIYSQADSASPA